ncbi:putative uncharacterized protein [Clostridium sp. CAG:411]|jgi:rod shape determining protein RodA|nr:putative uncharacterized protein [Clostridium sp. CAG:411]
MFNFKQYDWRRYNFTVLVVMVILCICSAYFVSFAISATMGEDKAGGYFRRQIISMIVSLIIAIVVSLIDYRRICDFVVIYYIIATLMVAATKLSPLGSDQKTGSYRWLSLPGVNLQPSEICKLVVIMALAVYFMKMREQMDSLKTFLIGVAIMIIPTFFILIQSDLSSSLVIFFVFAMMVFAAGLTYKIVIPILAVTIPTVIGALWFLQQPIAEKIIPEKHWYQVERIIGFMNPEKYSNSLMYQQLHSIQSIASGQLTGKLLSESASTGRNYSWVDVCESDFIFTVIGEEVGFIGCCLIVALLCIIIFMCIRTAIRCNETLGYLIAVGISAMFMFQVFANIGVATMILPNTGLPLPFLSNGISSMISCSIAIGIILNIGMQSGTGDRSGISFL